MAQLRAFLLNVFPLDSDCSRGALWHTTFLASSTRPYLVSLQMSNGSSESVVFSTLSKPRQGPSRARRKNSSWIHPIKYLTPIQNHFDGRLSGSGPKPSSGNTGGGAMCIVRIGSAAYVYTEFQVAWLTWLLCIFRWSGFRHVLQLSLWYYTKTTLEDARYNRPLFHIQNLINSLKVRSS